MYILINLFVSGVGFAKSFLFMKWLDMTELGIISLVQTVMLFVGLFQLGLLNGGYRIFALDKAEQQREINNLLFTYIGCLSFLGVLIWCILHVCNIMLVLKSELLLVAFVCGILALTNNWLTNTLIGKGLISNINKINLISAFVSLLLLPLVVVWGIKGAIVVLISQPLIFVAITLFQNKSLRPTGLNFDIKLARYILSFGFIPFLAGIFTIINLQIERWSIAEILGPEALGKFYLVFLYSTLFTLVPTSLLNIYFPKAINFHETGDYPSFQKLLIKHVQSVLIYLLTVILFTIIALQPFVDWLLPQHAENTRYVYLILPGLFFLTLCDPVSVLLNSTLRLKPILLVGLLSLILTTLFVFVIEILGYFNLYTMSILKTVVNLAVFICYISYIYINRYKLIKR